MRIWKTVSHVKMNCNWMHKALSITSPEMFKIDKYLSVSFDLKLVATEQNMNYGPDHHFPRSKFRLTANTGMNLSMHLAEILT